MKTFLAYKKVKIAVHGGTFHADDVVAVALASIYFRDTIKVDRVFRIDENNDYKFIIDVGGRFDGEKYFDHHQEDVPIDEDGVKACGLTLFAKKILENEEGLYDELYKYFMRSIAAQDNGQAELAKRFPNTLFGWVHEMNPAWNSNKSSDTAFFEAVKVAKAFLLNIIEKIEAQKQAKNIWEASPRDCNGATVILEQYIPWQEYAFEDGTVDFVIFPSNRGGFMLMAVPPSEDRGFEQRIPLDWKGTRPSGMTFVHPGKFCASFETEQDAILAARALKTTAF